MQGISASTTRALQLAEQRLAEAAAELQRRADALRDVTSQRDAALAEVHPAHVGLVGCRDPGNALLPYAPHTDNALRCLNSTDLAPCQLQPLESVPSYVETLRRNQNGLL